MDGGVGGLEFGMGCEASVRLLMELLKLGLLGGVGGGPVFFPASGLFSDIFSALVFSVASSTDETQGLASLDGGIGGFRTLKT